MQPVIFSVTEATCGRPGWARCGQEVVYYRNSFTRPQNSSTLNNNAAAVGGGQKKQTESRSFYTASFTVSFRHVNDVCYVAYHYPYTYTMMKVGTVITKYYREKMKKHPVLFVVLYKINKRDVKLRVTTIFLRRGKLLFLLQ